MKSKKSGQVVGGCYTIVNGLERVEWLKSYAGSLHITESMACQSLLNEIITAKMVKR
jgi:hypothetical protein